MAYAVPNYGATPPQFTPNDPGLRTQWNFFGPYGISMPEAWTRPRRPARPAAAARSSPCSTAEWRTSSHGRYRRAPDLRRCTFVHPWDFVERDRHPNDVYGHGTHVAGTIAQATNNGIGTAGIAYSAKIMPLRVLDSLGEGDSPRSRGRSATPPRTAPT